MIFLISCSSAKLPHAATARELYSASTLFRKSLAYAELRATPRCSIYVVSAKHHLVELDQVVEPYELSLMSLSPTERDQWGRRVWAQIVLRHRVRLDVCMLAGVEYANAIRGARLLAAKPTNTQDRLPFELPLAGMQIGERLRWLTVEIDRLSDRRARSNA